MDVTYKLLFYAVGMGGIKYMKNLSQASLGSEGFKSFFLFSLRFSLSR